MSHVCMTLSRGLSGGFDFLLPVLDDNDFKYHEKLRR